MPTTPSDRRVPPSFAWPWPVCVPPPAADLEQPLLAASDAALSRRDSGSTGIGSSAFGEDQGWMAALPLGDFRPSVAPSPDRATPPSPKPLAAPPPMAASGARVDAAPRGLATQTVTPALVDEQSAATRVRVGAGLGGAAVGVVFGLQFSGGSLRAWQTYATAPYFGLCSAMTAMVLGPWLCGRLIAPRAFFWVQSGRTLRLVAPDIVRRLDARLYAAGLAGGGTGALVGIMYAAAHGGHWRYAIFPAWLALTHVVPFLAVVRLLALPLLNDLAARLPASQESS